MTQVSNKFTLIVIDCQNDFSRKDGKMYIKNADKIIENIVNFIEENKNKIHKVIFTKDNHSPKHMSFKKNGGIWPEHCIAETEGSMINQDLIDVCEKNNLLYNFLNRGEVDNFEEYSSSLYSEHADCAFIQKTLTDMTKIYTDDIVICGMPGETSVAASANGLIEQLGQNHVSIFIDGIANIDSNNEIMKIIEDNVDVNIIYNSSTKF